MLSTRNTIVLACLAAACALALVLDMALSPGVAPGDATELTTVPNQAAPVVEAVGTEGSSSVDRAPSGPRPVDSYASLRAQKTERAARNRERMERTVSAVVERDEARHASRNIERYLDELVDRARQRGAATAVDIEPGMRAIDERIGELGPERAEALRADFSRRMLEVSGAGSDSTGSNSAGSAAEADTGQLLVQIADGKPGPQRQELIRRYTDAVEVLEPDEQDTARRQLEALLAGEAPNQADTEPEWRGLEDAIIHAEDEATRQQAVRAYLTATEQLPPAERDSRMSHLDSLLRSY